MACTTSLSAFPARACWRAPPCTMENRFNDGKCDPRGRLWAGTMHVEADRDREPTGALYRWSGGSLEEVIPRVSLSNGLGWSPPGDTMYFSDTHAGTVWAYDYDLATGAIADRRAFAKVPLEDGVPDGLTVDSAGNVYVAIWRGSRLDVFAPDGTRVAQIPVPVRNPTSCGFGGADLRTLFITTMPAGNEDDPRSGSLFALEVAVPGLPERADGPELVTIGRVTADLLRHVAPGTSRETPMTDNLSKHAPFDTVSQGADARRRGQTRDACPSSCRLA